ncbi:MAG: DNA-binding protein [Gordonia sp.]|uniref:Zinc ribbon domain-containing protein n=1 Tax=Gordonia rubripertincta TaxID=36822 RepID=A0ABT4MWG0_GORRU|nr:zinc ribbon domain-containing protein [Gordonia rubripertincta]MBA4024586.1 DNA-binding protein [Gordonia sp. (in: high G+C Gram-positive bacteria)]MCZ4551345.1 zinc ribbon domain-containing protein [Gordonia rubripertincta]
MAKALAPDVSTWPAENAQLIGSRCDACGATTWPKQDRCPRCSGPDMTELLLPRRGELIAFTTQGFVPKLPYAGGETAATFETFGMGLIQLGDVVRVEARLTEADPEKLADIKDVELTFIPFYTDADGTEIITWAFAPVTQS